MAPGRGLAPGPPRSLGSGAPTASRLRLAALVAAATAVSVLAQNGYPADVWAVVPTIGTAPTAIEQPPLACSCISNDNPCTKYDCTCTCNLRAQACDANCCCDPECSAAEVSRFSAANACLPSGPANSTVRRCIDLETERQLVYVNKRPRMSVERVPGAENVLCVAIDNNPARGSFFSDPGAQNAAVLSRPELSRAFTYQSNVAPPAGPVATSAGGFSIGDRVPLAIAGGIGGGGLRSAFGGFWSVPTGATDAKGAACALSGGGGYVGYRRDIAPQLCTTSVLLSAATCAAISASRFIAGLSVGVSPLSTPSSAASFVAVNLTGAQFFDAAAGSLLPSADPSAAIGAAGFDPATCSCAGALVALSFRASYTAATDLITGVSASVVLTTITQPLPLCSIVPVEVPLAVDVLWTPSNASLTAMGVSLAASNAIAQERSGSPGYLPGSPMLGGVLISLSGLPPAAIASTDKVAIARGASPVSGRDLPLSLRGPGPDGACVPFAPAFALDPGADSALPVPLAFRRDASLTCTQSMTSAAFAAACTPAGVATVLASSGFAFLTFNGSTSAAPSHIGALGSSDPLKAWQWVAIDVPAASPGAPTLDAAAQRCSNVVVGVDVEILSVRVGEARSPQYKVLAARLRPRTGTRVYAREDGGPQDFAVRTSVTWVDWTGNSAAEYVPPAPPVVPPLPADLFYPFLTSTSGQDSSNVVSGVAGVGVAAGVWLGVAIAGIRIIIAASIVAGRYE